MEIHLPGLSTNGEIVWSAFQIRVFVYVSWAIQVLLTLSAHRKGPEKKWLISLNYSASLFADWITPYAFGVLTNRQERCGNSSNIAHSNFPAITAGSYFSGISAINNDIVTFWVSFLLLHLGGTDNVNPYKKDQMWVKLLFGFIAQLVAVAIILVRYLPNSTLFLPTILLFVAGIIKYAERIHALRLASPNLVEDEEYSTPTLKRPIPRADYEKLVGVNKLMRDARLPSEIRSVQLAPKRLKTGLFNLLLLRDVVDEQGPLKKNMSLLQIAHCLYKNFKGFFVGGKGVGGFSSDQLRITRDYFLRITPSDAFVLLDMELGFAQQALHTKTVAVQNKIGFFFRVVSTGSVFAASFFFFQLPNKKRKYGVTDTALTYLLLVWAVVVEIISALLILFSYQTALALFSYNTEWSKHIACAIFKCRWRSNSVSKFNFIAFVLRLPTNHRIVRLMLANFQGLATLKLDSTFECEKEIIFKELVIRSRMVAEKVETATNICSQRGDWALMRSSCYSRLKWSLGEVEYEKSLLLWHIATDLCWDNNGGDDRNRRLCKNISEYMIYLLVYRPIMVAKFVSGNWIFICRDTFVEAKTLIGKKPLTKNDHEGACRVILSADTEIQPAVLKGDGSKSVLFDACRLAKQLLSIEEGHRWKLMSLVWVELLIYAAVNCDATVHAQQLSQDVELLTSVWLLMNHLGLGKQFCEEPARTGYKLVVKK